MKKPKMILFDYGQTLIKESKFNGVAGCAAVMRYAVKNKYHRTPEEVQARADAINAQLGRFDPAKRHLFQIEVPNHMFTSFLYESMGIELALTSQEIDRLFWDAASPGVPTEGIAEFLLFLKEQHIRTGVVSNITYCGEVVKERIDRMLPQHAFEYIIATSEYLYRKPHPNIFELALEKAELPPKEVWYVGDHYECDVVGSRNAGMFPVLYTGVKRTAPPEGDDVLAVSEWRMLMHIIAGLS